LRDRRAEVPRRGRDRGGERSPFARLDRNRDGRITDNEFTGLDARMLENSDFDGDGNVERAELEEAVSRLRDRRRR
ncbi:MAG: hypothetical protein WBF53_08620, partial [Litorimonas sp.]